VNSISRTLANIGFAMVMIGAIIMIILGIGAAFGIFLLIFYPVYALTAFFWGIAMIILGILAAGAARFVDRVGPALWIIIIAIIASIFGAWWIAWLIAIGAIIGLISRA
jgi:hypothetical protein